jgi:DNA-binding MarR family transcriptional regulator
MDARQTADRFAELYTAIYRHTYRRRDPREQRISGESLAMLQHLRDSGPLTVSEAARHFDRSQAAISERIERLIERGLVTRVPDERDRRRHLIWLSEAGEELLSLEREVLSSELLVRATKLMSVADRKALIEGMRALIAASVAAERQRRKEMS